MRLLAERNVPTDSTNSHESGYRFMILLIDNYDSFVHNLARYFVRLGHETTVVRNDAIDCDGVRALSPGAIVISPGPCTPNEAGCSEAVVHEFHKTIPILGVCLGHQTIATALGGTLTQANQPVHGRTSEVSHDGQGMFKGLPSSMTVCRYHSLIIDEPELVPELTVTARCADGTPMAIAHQHHPVYGVQFHPESVLTEHGFVLLANFLKAAGLPIHEPLPTINDERDVPAPVELYPANVTYTF